MMDWKICLNKQFAKAIKIDTSLITSLLRTSANKLKTQELLVMNEHTAVSKVSLTYDALRELLEALAITKGYKIYNHECYTAFLKEILKESTLGDTFDTYRKLRNNLNYYGKEITLEEAEKSIKDMKELRETLQTTYVAPKPEEKKTGKHTSPTTS